MFQNVLREIRKRRKMTQVQLAQAAGLAHNYISDLERGEATNPSRQTIQKLAEALGIPESMLRTEFFHASSAADTAQLDIGAFENLLLDPAALEQERGIIPAANPALTPTPADSHRAGHLYRGYRVMRLRPDGETYCARTFARVDDEGLPQHHYDQGTGIEWGYLGHGPQTLAYDILAYEAGESLARYHHRAFHSDVVATLPHYVSHAPGVHLEWTLIGEEIRDWLRQQDRPHIIGARLGLDIWRRGPDGRLHTLVYEQFLLDRRYALELELAPFEHRAGEYLVKVLQIYEEQFAPLESGLPVWQFVRDVASTQVSIPFSVRVPE